MTTAKSRSSSAASAARAVGGGLDVVARVAQDLGEALADAGLVVGDQDGVGHRAGLCRPCSVCAMRPSVRLSLAPATSRSSGPAASGGLRGRPRAGS